MTDSPVDRLRSLREAIEALPVHSIDGYEWECDICQFRFAHSQTPPPDGVTEGSYDPDGVLCTHLALLDRDRVFEALAALEAEK